MGAAAVDPNLFDWPAVPPHPATYTDTHLAVFYEFIEPGSWVLDPFAGTGGVHELRRLLHAHTVGVEIEPEWAAAHPYTICADALRVPFPDASFDAIVTSPTYGNRMADHHDAADASVRATYRHTLGRPLHPDNSGNLQWGTDYQDFHRRAWAKYVPVLRPGGRLILNVKDHIRRGERQPVSAWHAHILLGLGLRLVDCVPIATPGMGYGANRHARVGAELVWVFEKEA
jgi:DNA modification methylase